VADRGRARLARVETQAASFDRTRSDHRSEIAEDYVELIADLIDAKGEAPVPSPACSAPAWSAASPIARSS
jgi:hypothetical protein